MKTTFRSATACLFALGTLLSLPLDAQRGGPPSDTVRRVLVVPGQRDGTSTFPLTNYKQVQPLVAGQMDFKHYHTSAEVEEWMRKWAREKPDLVELYTVGRSFGGREIWQMTLTNKKTGSHMDKPAAFYEGGRHSGEITSTESALYLAWHLLEKYGSDTAITRLLDKKAIYIRPLNNPDGSDMYRLTAQANRSTVRPYDDDGDGLLDEDAGEDLDGDGFIRQARKFVGAGKGNAVVDTADKSGRLMRGVPMGQGDYLQYPEGVDNDKDGRINEDGIGGLDLHRNYPYNWRPMREPTGRANTQGGAGEFPLSEPETRAVVMWLMQHANVSVSNSMDTSVPMHLRGPSTCEEEVCMFPADRKLFLYFDSVGLSHTGYPWAGNVYRTYATRGNPDAQPQALYGHGPDWGYFQFGAIWYGDELWNGGRERDYNKDGRWDQYEVLRYCDEEFGGECFKKWTKFQHPDLGEIEIGGYDPKFFSQNGPPSVLEKWARNQALFNLDMALALPEVEIVSVTAVKAPALKLARGAVADSATHEIRITLRNTGLIPTALDQAQRVKIVRPDIVTLTPPRGSTARVIGIPAEFHIGGKSTRTVTQRVRVTSATEFTVRYSSTRGGLAQSTVVVSPAGTP